MQLVTGLRPALLLSPALALTCACASPKTSGAPAEEARSAPAAAAAADADAAAPDASPRAAVSAEDAKPAPTEIDAEPADNAAALKEEQSADESRSQTRLDIAVPSINGGLNRDIIRRIASDHADDLRSCHGRALAANAELTGKIVVELTIDSEGRVLEAELGKDSNYASPDARSCMLELIEGWEFPSPTDGKQGSVELALEFGE